MADQEEINLGLYLLGDDGITVTECRDTILWGRFMDEGRKKHMLRHLVKDHKTGEEVRVSTVFIGIDHSFGEPGAPVLWETMVFGGTHDDFQRRYRSAQDAREGHKMALEMVRTGKKHSDLILLKE